MKKLLIVSNLPSNNTKILLDQVKKGAESIGSENIKIISSDAINITYNSILESSAIILGTTENLGYMSGIIKERIFNNIFYIYI